MQNYGELLFLTLALIFAYQAARFAGGWDKLSLARELITKQVPRPFLKTLGLCWKSENLTVVYEAPTLLTREKITLHWTEKRREGFFELVAGGVALFCDPGDKPEPASFGTERVLPELLALARARFSA